MSYSILKEGRCLRKTKIMRKILFGLMLMLFFTSNMNAQQKKLYCYTVSCCSVGPIGIEIWSHKVCVYAEVIKEELTSVEFQVNPKYPLSEVVIDHDMLLSISNEKQGWVLPKGTYGLKNNMMTFKPEKVKTTTYCIERRAEGSLFGHAYNYSLKLCITVSASTQNAVVAIDTNLNKDELVRLKEYGNEIEIKEDISLKEAGIGHVLKAGKYIVNEDGKIYLDNISSK